MKFIVSEMLDGFGEEGSGARVCCLMSSLGLEERGRGFEPQCGHCSGWVCCSVMSMVAEAMLAAWLSSLAASKNGDGAGSKRQRPVLIPRVRIGR